VGRRLDSGETVLPLDKATSELNVSDFVPGGWNLYGWKGVQYGIPLDLDFNLLFYRKDVYEKAMQTLGMTELPTNTQDFLKVAAQVVKDTGKPAVIQFPGRLLRLVPELPGTHGWQPDQ